MRIYRILLLVILFFNAVSFAQANINITAIDSPLLTVQINATVTCTSGACNGMVLGYTTFSYDNTQYGGDIFVKLEAVGFDTVYNKRILSTDGNQIIYMVPLYSISTPNTTYVWGEQIPVSYSLPYNEENFTLYLIKATETYDLIDITPPSGTVYFHLTYPNGTYHVSLYQTTPLNPNPVLRATTNDFLYIAPLPTTTQPLPTDTTPSPTPTVTSIPTTTPTVTVPSPTTIITPIPTTTSGLISPTYNIPPNNSTTGEIYNKTSEWGNITNYGKGNGSISDWGNLSLRNITSRINTITGIVKGFNFSSHSTTFGTLISAGVLNIIPDDIWQLFVVIIVLAVVLMIFGR